MGFNAFTGFSGGGGGGSFFKGLFGSKPEVPDLDQIDISDEQRKAIQQNLDNLPYAEDLASKVNLFNEGELAKQLGVSVDWLRNLKRSAGENISDMIHGEIPDDILDRIQTRGAERGLFAGVGGSPASRSWTARDLGLTSLDLFSKGLSSAERWMAFNRSGMFDVSSMFFTPQQRLAFTVEERNLKFQQSWLKNQISAMPDPVMRGIYDSIMSLAVAYLGGNYQGRNLSQEASQAGVPASRSFGGVGGSDYYGPADAYEGLSPDYYPGMGGSSGFDASNQIGPTGDYGAGFGGGFGGFV